jgi:hypothetical protein
MNPNKNQQAKIKSPTPNLPSHQWQMDFLHEQFEKESDRAAVILVMAMIDQALKSLIKGKLVPLPNTTDSLFDDINSAFGSFSAKIDMSYRLGLISAKLCRDLHIFRKIRNAFAHDIFDCDFENNSVKSRINELKLSMCFTKNKDISQLEVFEGGRGIFLNLTSAIMWHLNNLILKNKSLKDKDLEWLYNENVTDNDTK